MQNTKKSSLKSETPLVHDNATWFNELVSQIRVDELNLAAGTAPAEVTNMYNAMFTGDVMAIHNIQSGIIARHFIKKMLAEFYKELLVRGAQPLELYVDYTSNMLLVWSIINDNDQDAEDAIYLSEAKLNSIYAQNGFSVDTIVFEKSDSIPVPNQYIKLK